MGITANLNFRKVYPDIIYFVLSCGQNYLNSDQTPRSPFSISIFISIFLLFYKLLDLNYLTIIIMTIGLTQEQIDLFHQEGCIVIPNELSKEQVQALMTRSKKMLDEFSLENHPMTKFTTGDSVGGDGHVGDDYFLESSDKVHFFFEEAAFVNGELTKPKEKAINKIGHFLHELDPEFKKVSLTARNNQIAKDLGVKDPLILQSMLICKQPEIGGEVPSHQDAPFLYTDPVSCLGFWYALEDCTADNGALEYVPGSHKTCGVYKRFVRTPDNHGTTFEPVEGVEPYEEPDKSAFKLVECPAGSLVLINHSVLHRSNQNLSQNSRYAYAFHSIDGECEYDERNWLQIPVSGGHDFTKLVVANQLTKKVDVVKCVNDIDLVLVVTDCLRVVFF